MPYVFSTLTASVKYTQYEKGKDFHTPKREVLIRGGSNVADKHVVTRLGVATQVSDEDLAWLKEDLTFKTHVKNNFIRVHDAKADPEKIITSQEMETRDESSPLTPADYLAEGKEPPKTSTSNDEDQ